MGREKDHQRGVRRPVNTTDDLACGGAKHDPFFFHHRLFFVVVLLLFFFGRGEVRLRFGVSPTMMCMPMRRRQGNYRRDCVRGGGGTPTRPHGEHRSEVVRRGVVVVVVVFSVGAFRGALSLRWAIAHRGPAGAAADLLSSFLLVGWTFHMPRPTGRRRRRRSLRGMRTLRWRQRRRGGMVGGKREGGHRRPHDVAWGRLGQVCPSSISCGFFGSKVGAGVWWWWGWWDVFLFCIRSRSCCRRSAFASIHSSFFLPFFALSPLLHPKFLLQRVGHVKGGPRRAHLRCGVIVQLLQCQERQHA